MSAAEVETVTNAAKAHKWPLAVALLRRGLGACTAVYLVCLVAWLGCLRYFGEEMALTAIGIFVPPAVWLLPLAVLSPCAFAFSRRTLAFHALAVVLVFFGYCRFHVGGFTAPRAHEATIRLMTNNVGQSNRQPITKFVDSTQPDIIVLQEVKPGATDFGKLFPDRYVVGKGQFLILSKHRVVNAEHVKSVSSRGVPVAARFEVDIRGQRLVIYNVHLPTPRYDFLRVSPRELVVDVLDPSTPDAVPRRGLRSSMQERIRLGRELIALSKKEQLPVIMAGDFNMPDTGRLYPIFSAAFSDSFAQAGFGYGHTFPGFTRNPLSLFQPWLRLDYIFAGEDIKPLACQVEQGRPAQHRAVVATLQLPAGELDGANSASSRK